MACPTCDHTMNTLGPDVFWCPRCGTVRDEGIQIVPKLVERTRDLFVSSADPVPGMMRSFSIVESIYTPDMR